MLNNMFLIPKKFFIFSLAFCFLICAGVAGFFIVNKFTEKAIAGQVRTVEFPSGASYASRAGYGYDDTYRLAIPSSYNGCYVKIAPMEGDNCNAYCDLAVSAKNCNNQIGCAISASPGETIDMTFAPNDSCSDCAWYYYIYTYGWCGDGDCEYYSDALACVDGQLKSENCSNCPSDCPTAANSVCCSGVQYGGGECCGDSDCGSGKKCQDYECVSSAYCGDGACNNSETCSTCSADCGSCKKSDGSACSAAGECSSGYCAQSKCSSSSSYCGDGTCNSSETCSACSSDCGGCQPSRPSALNFSASGGTQDGGAVTSADGGYSWTVNLPNNFIKVETAHYDKNTPSSVKKYMGWNGVLKVNGAIVWEFKSWTAATGGLIFDGSLNQEVKESTGSGGWIDATKFFKAGSNTVYFDHFNEGGGIGLKIKVTAGAVKKSDGSICSAAGECSGGYCVYSKCRSVAVYCGDQHCDGAESCDCADCVKTDRCAPKEESAAKKPEEQKPAEQKTEEKVASKKKDGESCSANEQCQSNNCLNKICRPKNYAYCGDKICQNSENCNCQDCSEEAKCQKPKFDLSIAAPADIKAGEKKSFEIIIENKGKDALTGVKLKMFCGREKTVFTNQACQGKEPCVFQLSDVPAGEKLKAPSEYAEFIFPEPIERTEVQLFVEAGNSTKTQSASAEKDVALQIKPVNLKAELSQTSIIGEVKDFQKMQLKLSANDYSQITRNNIKIKIKSENSSIAAVNVSPSFSGKGYLAFDQINYFELQTVTFYVDFQKAGFTNMNLEITGDNIERISKNLAVEAMAQPPALLFNVSPAGLIMEKGEQKEIAITIKNQGKGLAYRPKAELIYDKSKVIILEKSVPRNYDSIKPGQEIKDKFNIKAEQAGQAELEFTVKYAAEPAAGVQPNYKFNNSRIVSLGIEEKKQVCQNDECAEQVKCLVEVSNTMGCGLELVDVVPYLDKPTAAVLATADACDIKERMERNDPLGAGVTSFLAVVDLGDNAADAVPMAGNAAAAAVDAIEGAADCMEGFVYDTVDEYCAGKGEIGGYTGCFKNIAETTAYYTGQAAQTANSASTAIFGMFGSPVSFRIADNSGRELGARDGVLIIEQGELKTFLIKNPEKLTNGYNIELIGTDTGTYSLHTALIANGKVVGEDVISDQQVKRAEAQKIALAVAESNGQISNFSVADKEVPLAKDAITQKNAPESAKQNKTSWIIGVIAAVLIIAGSVFYVRRYKK